MDFNLFNMMSWVGKFEALMSSCKKLREIGCAKSQNSRESTKRLWLGTAGVWWQVGKENMDKASELKKERVYTTTSLYKGIWGNANFKAHEAEQEKQHKDPGRVIGDPGPSVGQADTCPHESCKAATKL